jgi:cytochrome P450
MPSDLRTNEDVRPGPPTRVGADWIVARPADVTAALTAPALHVVPPRRDAGAAASLLARMARFTESAAHQRRRDLVVTMLPPAGQLTEATSAWMARVLSGLDRAVPFDVMPVARTGPAAVLAGALGLAPGPAARAAEQAGRLCDLIGHDAADAAATSLLALLADAVGPGERADAAASILFQARDATAALIGLTLLRSGAAGQSVASRVEHVLREDAPVRNTRRVAMSDVTIGGCLMPAGATVVVSLAAGPGRDRAATFGTGPHGCPGHAQAIELATVVVTELEQAGWRATDDHTEFADRPNLLSPRRVLLAAS